MVNTCMNFIIVRLNVMVLESRGIIDASSSLLHLIQSDYYVVDTMDYWSIFSPLQYI